MGRAFLLGELLSVDTNRAGTWTDMCGTGDSGGAPRTPLGDSLGAGDWGLPRSSPAKGADQPVDGTSGVTRSKIAHSAAPGQRNFNDLPWHAVCKTESHGPA